MEQVGLAGDSKGTKTCVDYVGIILQTGGVPVLFANPTTIQLQIIVLLYLVKSRDNSVV
jgi:hypothetical protein